MLFDVVLLFGGLVLVIQGGDWFVSAAVRIAGFLRMPRVVIGSTLVSLATSMPEFVVSVTAGLKRESGLAVGNAVGSVICNIGLILGVTAAIKQVDVHLRSLRVPLMMMLGLGALVLLLTLDLRLSRGEGAALLVLGATYFVCEFAKSFRGGKPEDLQEAAAIADEKLTGGRFLETKPGTSLQFLLGAAVVIVGSRLLVDGAADTADRLGIPSIIVGLSVVAVGTSLPELVTAITCSRKNVSDLSVGNVLGANIANLSFVVGTAAMLQDVTVDRATQVFNFPAMLALMALLFWMLRTDKRLTRAEGMILLSFYGCYLTALVGLTVLGGD